MNNEEKKIDLTGRWLIVSWQQIYDDGRRTFPMGETLEGFIEYGPHGMFCLISKSNRQSFSTGGQWNANEVEKANAYGSFMAYAGDFEVQGSIVKHYVKQSLFPNWVGGIQQREASIDGDVLCLSARLEEGTSEARLAHLMWRKASSKITTQP